MSPGLTGQRLVYSSGLVPAWDGVTCGRPRSAAARDVSETKSRNKGKTLLQPVVSEHQSKAHKLCFHEKVILQKY